MMQRRSRTPPRSSFNGNHEHDEAEATQLMRIAGMAKTKYEILETNRLVNNGLELWQSMYRRETRHNVDRWERVIRTVIRTTYAANYELMRKENYPESLFVRNNKLLKAMTLYDEKLPFDVALKLFSMKIRDPKKYKRHFGEIDEHLVEALKAAKNPIPIEMAIRLLTKRIEDRKAYERYFQDGDVLIKRSIDTLDGNISHKIAVWALIIKANDRNLYDQYFKHMDKEINSSVKEFIRSE